MTACTDDERREVAERLREHSGVRLFTGEDVERLIGIELSGFRPKDADNSYNRLADLIEPSEPEGTCVAEVKVDGERLEKLAHDAAVELTGIDRDALLALADEMGHPVRQAVWNQTPGVRREHIMAEYARRIREALGVTDG